MFLRVLTMVFGLAGGAGLSRFPEYSQQYRQRLGGAVDELAQVVAQFDADARAEGYDRASALASMAASGGFPARRAATMQATIARYDRLRTDLRMLQDAGPFTRLALASHVTEPAIARATLAEFRPAFPLTFEGLTMGAAGFGLGILLVQSLVWLFTPAPQRRRRRRAQNS